jgi:cholesterol transport system auxiliary component
VSYRIALVLLLPVVAGCLQLPTASDPMRVVAPRLQLDANPAWPAVDWTLLVQRPVADQMRGSGRIVVTTGGTRLAFYPGVMWLDELPDMLQALVIQGFADSGRIAGVARPGAARGTHYLAIDIRRFDAVERPDRSLEVAVTLYVNLIDVPTAGILASRNIGVQVPVAGTGIEALTHSFESAISDVVTELVGWTLTAGAGDPSAAVLREP